MASTLENIIEINQLNKSFGTVKAVNDLSFRVKRGELFAFLGVNGAGKSTTISMICGQLAADGGEIRVNGWDVNRSGKKIKEMTGVVFQDSVLDKPLTARENLKSRAALYGITGKKFEERLQELITIFELQEFINRPVGKLSGGQRRRVDIARALVHRPQLLILDEPTTGLDPQTRKMIWSIIETLREKEGLTVLLTTHYMEEAASASYIVIIDHGCKKVVCSSDGMKITCKMKIDIFHWNNLRITAACSSALYAEYWSKGRLTKSYHNVLSKFLHTICKTYSSSSFTFSCRSWVDSCNKD